MKLEEGSAGPLAGAASHPAAEKTPVVNSFTEWDPLEEVIVGTLDGQAQQGWEAGFYSYLPRGNGIRDQWRESTFGREGRPVEVPEIAKKELEEFVRVLEGEGVKVRRPEPIDRTRPIVTPDFSIPGGGSQTCPRDVMVVIGNEIIESPMAFRYRFFEYVAYRKLIKEYFHAGAKWTQAPKPQMKDDLYNNLYFEEFKQGVHATTEVEPVFDAADIARIGKDIFVQRSNVTNEFGIEWLRRHLGDNYRVHQLDFDDPRAVHIDATWVPLCPGKILISPDRPLRRLPEIFNNSGWEFLEPPRTVWPDSDPFHWQMQWLLINVLMLDEKRVIVEEEEGPFNRQMKDWGFKPIPVKFRNVWRYGGGFHCFTADVRRRGTLKSYF